MHLFGANYARLGVATNRGSNDSMARLAACGLETGKHREVRNESTQ
jgi:hypothetical protein